MNRQIRVVIVDDEKPARARLITLLERQPGVQVTAACSGGQEALEAVSAAARSHIVNFHFVHELVQDAHGDYVAMLNDGTALKIGRRYRSRLEARLNQRL